MAANLFGRYVWLIDTLRRYKRLTFQLEPESVRNEMRNFAKNMLDYYTWEEDKPCKE